MILLILDDNPVLIPLPSIDSIGTYYFVQFGAVDGGEIVQLDNRYFVQPKRFYKGIDTLRYTICFGECLDQCKEGSILLNFSQDFNCDIPNIITPNGDGINDYFLLPCLGNEDWGSADLFIFDTWGNEVYKSLDYKNDFDGVVKGSKLPSDTYF
ncbi:MAG TPA: gliding motility-associated C-terminal domain-containing protein, partial [Saprospiraceae bacterium]|nr:gliding motility-associated C-terminal domain-containing protein [Saprospiraceae bacterium]